jgi:hypothetical protein
MMPDTAALRMGWRAANDYRVAPVTMENSDWMFAAPYDNAVLRNDDNDAARIRRLYLDYTAKAIAWYREAALSLLGRRPAFGRSERWSHQTFQSGVTAGEISDPSKERRLKNIQTAGADDRHDAGAGAAKIRPTPLRRGAARRSSTGRRG